MLSFHFLFALFGFGGFYRQPWKMSSSRHFILLESKLVQQDLRVHISAIQLPCRAVTSKMWLQFLFMLVRVFLAVWTSHWPQVSQDWKVEAHWHSSTTTLGTKKKTVLLRLHHFGLKTRHHSFTYSVALCNQIQSDSQSKWILAIMATLLVCAFVWALQSSPDRWRNWVLRSPLVARRGVSASTSII